MDPLPFGSELELVFTLPKPSSTLRCGGYVAWSTKSQADPIQGVGVRLTDISVADMRSLASFVDHQLSAAPVAAAP